MIEFSIATISIFVGTLNELTKWISKKCFNYDIAKYIPIFSIGYGLILGVVGFFIPDISFGKNIIEAIFIGIASGGNAVGFHQIYKQLTKTVTDTEEEEESTTTEESETTETEDTNDEDV